MAEHQQGNTTNDMMGDHVMMGGMPPHGYENVMEQQHGGNGHQVANRIATRLWVWFILYDSYWRDQLVS